MPLNKSAIMAIAKAKVGDGSEYLGADADAIAALAADELANCMNNAIAGCLTGNEMYAVGMATPSQVTKMGGGLYLIGVDIQAQFRPSINPAKYGGYPDMAKLFNNGYGPINQIVARDEHGNYIGATRPYRSPAHFVQAGMQSFAGCGGGAYTVLSTQVSGRFGG